MMVMMLLNGSVHGGYQFKIAIHSVSKDGTAEGHKAMADLQVGDAVLATVASGETVFDQVYFFGHADAHVRTMLKKLELQI